MRSTPDGTVRNAGTRLWGVVFICLSAALVGPFLAARGDPRALLPSSNFPPWFRVWIWLVAVQMMLSCLFVVRMRPRLVAMISASATPWRDGIESGLPILALYVCWSVLSVVDRSRNAFPPTNIGGTPIWSFVGWVTGSVAAIAMFGAHLTRRRLIASAAPLQHPLVS